MNLYLLLSLILLTVTTRLFLGIFDHREFGTQHLFLKHKPTVKFYFSAPRGESDKLDSELTAHELKEERKFKEFVENGEGYKRSIWLRI